VTFNTLLAILFLLMINGFFVAAEFALTASRRHALEERTGRGARAALSLMGDLSLSLAGAQLGITVASLLLGLVAEPAVSALIEATVGAVVAMPVGVLHTVGFVVSLVIVVFLHMVVGEMAPKNIAITDPERAAVWLAPPFRVYMTVFRPIIVALNAVANLVLRLVGIEPRETLETTHTAEDLATLITAGRREGVIEEFAHRLLTRAIRFGERDASEVMVPRPEIVALPVDSTPADVERVVVEAGVSRIPLYREHLDDVVGLIHAKDLLNLDPFQRDRPLNNELIRPLLVVPESGRLGPLLAAMRRSRSHLALVVDEHGGTAGVVTLEDVAEELVGDIRDEHDPSELGMRRLGDRWFLVPGWVRPDQLTEVMGLELPEGEYETLGGFVMDRLGRIPKMGDRVETDGWVLRVRRMDGRRVDEVELIGS
jgi:CBS domain containing-hemolysin-like protein